jgi:hypothetical protein
LVNSANACLRHASVSAGVIGGMACRGRFPLLFPSCPASSRILKNPETGWNSQYRTKPDGAAVKTTQR